jgi:hypothetical protein
MSDHGLATSVTWNSAKDGRLLRAFDADEDQPVRRHGNAIHRPHTASGAEIRERMQLKDVAHESLPIEFFRPELLHRAHDELLRWQGG